MTIVWDEIAHQVITTLSEQEKKTCATYIDQHIFNVGAALKLNRREHIVTEATVLAFIDLDPAANWGHNCRYLLFEAESNRLKEKIEGQFPPDRDALRLIHRGESVEDWMLLTTQQLDK